MSPNASDKKDIQKLQRAVVDGLEDVKAQDICVFNTEHLSPLFERVIVAAGNSNRQTKALAISVIDAVREAGFAKPRMEGEENGEWIIVDCGAVVVHIMQPTIRQYYHLEEIWGDKPVRLKLGAPKPAQPQVKAAPAKAASKAANPSLRRSSAAKTAVREAEREAAQAKKAAAKKPTRAKKSAAPKPTAPKPAAPRAAKSANRAAPAPATPAKKSSAPRLAAKKPAAKAPRKAP